MQQQSRLSNSNVGIICLTPDNINKPWLNFEAGAIAKSVNHARVVPLLHKVNKLDLRGPFASFQAIALDKDGVRRLVKMLRDADPTVTISNEELESIFEA